MLINQETKDILISLDSTIESASFLLSGEVRYLKMKIQSPSGRVIDNSQVSYTQTNSMKIYRIQNISETGNWKLSLRSTSNQPISYNLLVNAKSEFDVNVNLVSETKNSTHPGYEKMVGNPIAGSYSSLIVQTSSDAFQVDTLQLIDERSNQVKKEFAVEALSSTEYFVKKIQIPDFPFYFRATGSSVQKINKTPRSRHKRDIANENAKREVARVISTILTPVKVALTEKSSGSSNLVLGPNQISDVILNFTNYGDPDYFG